MSLTSPISFVSDAFSFYRVSCFLNLLHFLSSDESYSLGDVSDNYGSYSGSSDTCSFPLRFD